MGLVDAYGDVPCSESGKGVSEGFLSGSGDDDATIYDDLYKELKEATAAFESCRRFWWRPTCFTGPTLMQR